ncbi:MAG: hypothetical protein WCP33_02090 [Deltaproteobacteria bacterium]
MAITVMCVSNFVAGCSSGSSTSSTQTTSNANQSHGYGSITAKLSWDSSPKTTAKKVGLAPSGVSIVRIIVSASDITPSLQKDFQSATGSGTIDGVPAGTGRTLMVQGLDASGAVTYQGTAANITVQAGLTTDVGTIVMIPITLATLDCIPSTPGSSLLLIQGDPIYTLPGGQQSLFSGTADPSMRKDPTNNTLWLSYSYPHYEFIPSRMPAVEVHLANSTDGGTTWNAVKTLWPSELASNPKDPTQNGVINHEVSNLLPLQENGVTTWMAARLDYFLPQGGNPVGESFRIKIMKASTPEGLSTASTVSLGSAGSDPAWPIDQNLSNLAPELADVSLWNEPALYYENGTLYLILVSFHYNKTVPDLVKDKIHVFSTTPIGAPASWTWSYRGVLAGNAEAVELGGQRLTQVDIAKGMDGKLLMIATPDDWNTTYSDYNHKGCVVVEIASLSSPALARGADGKLKLRSRVTASDANSLGSGASAYDPASNTGLLFTRRNKTSTNFTIEIWKTGLRF